MKAWKESIKTKIHGGDVAYGIGEVCIQTLMSMWPKRCGKALEEEPKAFEHVNTSQYKAWEICEKN